MKKLFLFVATIAITLASCSNDKSVVTPKEETKGSIEFRTLTDKGTRAAITDETNILSFTVTGMKQSDPSSYLFNAFGITRGENSSWDYTPKRYWPEGDKIDFYAYSPSSSRNVNNGITNYVSGTPIKYTVPKISKNNAQEDFLVARIKDQDKNSGNVKLNFHHALSRVMFFAKTSQAKITYTIGKVELLHLNQTGELNLDTTAIKESGSITYGSTPLVVWENQSDMVDYTVDMGESPIYLLNDYKSILGQTGAILVLPQATKISAAGTGKTAPAADEFAIKVEYRAFVDDQYYAGSPTTPAVKYFAVKDILGGSDGISFEMGRQYNFYLGFGDEVNGEIKFEVGVSEWNNTPAQYIPEPNNYYGLISDNLAKRANALFDAANNPVVTLEQMDTVVNLKLKGNTSFNFTGIEYFRKLASISLTNVKLGDLDASKTLSLTTVTITGSTLGNVNLSNGKLTGLTLSGNNTFASLNASNNKLASTSVTFSSGSKIDGDLNLSGNTTLTAIDLSNVGYITSSKLKLDLSNCGLKDDDVTLSSTKISNLNLSNNKLTTLDIISSTFENLDISNNDKLTIVNFDKSSVKTGTGTGLLNAKGNTALKKIDTTKDGSDVSTNKDIYIIDNLDISDSKGLEKMEVRYGYTVNTLTVWDGCTYTYLTAGPAYILNVHSSHAAGYVNNIKTADGTTIK